PVPWTDLVAGLARRFGVEESRLEPVLRRLVGTGALLTDLDPPADCTDPLGHVLTVGGDVPEVVEALRGTGGPPPVQTDLRLDADLTLPAEVAREAERAAAVLWRLSTPVTAPWLTGYHERFLEA